MFPQRTTDIQQKKLTNVVNIRLESSTPATCEISSHNPSVWVVIHTVSGSTNGTARIPRPSTKERVREFRDYHSCIPKSPFEINIIGGMVSNR